MIKPNEPEFTQALVEMIQEKAKVTILRISDIVIAFDNDVVHALFTLYEKPDKYGPVEIPKNDVPLEGKVEFCILSFCLKAYLYYFFIKTNIDAESSLRSAFQKDKIQLEFKDATTGEVNSC